MPSIIQGFWTLVLTSGLVLGTITPVSADAPSGGKLFEKLDLSKDQKASLEKLRKDQKGKWKGDRSKLRDQRKALEAAMEKNSSDSELKSLFNQIQTTRSQIAQAHFDHMLAVRKILTPDQRKKLHTLMKEKFAERRGKWKEMHEKMKSEE